MTQAGLFDALIVAGIPRSMEDADEEAEMQRRCSEARRQCESKTLCICGHEERDHFCMRDRGCHWSEGSGAQYHDCECNYFSPA